MSSHDSDLVWPGRGSLALWRLTCPSSAWHWPRLWQHAAMAAATCEITCPGCGAASESSGSSGTGWRSRGYSLRRCSACQAVSLVSAQQQPGPPWACVWCSAQNDGFRVRGDPATATLAELVDGIVRRGLLLAPGSAPQPLRFSRRASVRRPSGRQQRRTRHVLSRCLRSRRAAQGHNRARRPDRRAPAPRAGRI